MKKRILVDGSETEKGMEYWKVPQVLMWRFYMRIVGKWFTPCSSCQEAIDERWRSAVVGGHCSALDSFVNATVEYLCGKCKKEIQKSMLDADKVIMGNKEYEPPIELQRSWIDLEDHIAPIVATEYDELRKRFGNTFFKEYYIEDLAMVTAFFFSFSRK